MVRSAPCSRGLSRGRIAVVRIRQPRFNFRPMNACKACGYTWQPRGHNISRACPSCRSTNVRAVGLGWFGTLVVFALIALFVAMRKPSSDDSDAKSRHGTAVKRSKGPKGPASSIEPKAPAVSIGAAEGSTVNATQRCGVWDGDAVEYVARDTPLVVFGKKAGRTQVKSPDGRVGWVADACVR